MKATNVEELIMALEVFETEQTLSISTYRGKPCIKVLAIQEIYSERGTILIPSKDD